MENRRPHAALRITLIAIMAASAGCHGHSPVIATAPLPSPASTPLAITQDAGPGGPRFRFCDADRCPLVTPKMLLTSASHDDAAEGRAKPGTAGAMHAHGTHIDIPFAFNAIRMDPADKARLLALLRSAHPVSVSVTGRSDAIGPPAVRRNVARARAAEVRTAILEAAPGVTVTVAYDLATGSAPSAARRHQRRATVQLIPSPHQP